MIAGLRTIAQAQAALAEGRTSSRALVDAALEAAAAGEGPRVFLRLYAGQARESADAMDRLRAQNRAPGPLAGIPISIKDLFDVACEVTQAGSTLLADKPPATSHAPSVQRCLAAGLIPVGRTNMTEFAFSGLGANPHFPTPRSPWNRARGHLPGGSSSGAAVSVSDGMALAGLGTDTGGSCRIPAAFCGIAGFKPTQRRVPLDGVYPLAPSLDSVGPLAPSAACCAAIDAILAGEPDRALPAIGVAGLRLLLPQTIVLDGMDSATERSLDRAVRLLNDAGALIDTKPFLLFDRLMAAHAQGGLAASEAFAHHAPLLAAHRDQYDDRVASRIEAGARMAAPDYARLAQARARLIAEFAAEMAGYDALLAPTVPIAPPSFAAIEPDPEYWRLNGLVLRNPSLINFLDGCAISLPCHAAGDPPAGLMLAAPAMQDAKLLAIATSVERVLAG